MTQPCRGKLSCRCNLIVSRRSRSLIWDSLVLEALLRADDARGGPFIGAGRVLLRKDNVDC